MFMSKCSILIVKGLFVCEILSMVAHAADPPDHVLGRLLAVGHPGIDQNRRRTALQVRGAKVSREIPALDLEVLDVPEESSEAILQSLRATGLFDAVERDSYAHLAALPGNLPNDPSYGRQWHLPQISAPQAWTVTTGAAAIVVAVIDSGADSTHLDLAHKIAPGWNFLTNDADTTDQVGHGTAVAGTIAAASDNGIGVAGVIWSGQIMPLVAVDATGFASYSNMAAAIQYAADHGARVINISIGGNNPSSVLQSAVDYAWSRSAVVFAAAMNDSSTTPNYPAACNHAVAVSATDSNDALASFSNYGNWISLAAPGNNILTTSMGGGYGYWSGTSFSSPIVSGVAALVLAVNPSLTPAALVTLLEETADSPVASGFGPSLGWGRVNAYKAVMSALPPSVTLTPGPLAITLNGGETQQFTTKVTGLNNTPIAWSLSPKLGSISSTGMYTAPPVIAVAEVVTVTAVTAGAAMASSTVALSPAPGEKRSPDTDPSRPPRSRNP